MVARQFQRRAVMQRVPCRCFYLYHPTGVKMWRADLSKISCVAAISPLPQSAVDGGVSVSHAGHEEKTCGGGLTHEAVVNVYGDGYPVLTLQDHVYWFEGRKQAQLAQSVVRWNRDTNELTTMVRRRRDDRDDRR